jgi:hypothetical protein
MIFFKTEHVWMNLSGSEHSPIVDFFEDLYEPSGFKNAGNFLTGLETSS